MHRVWLSVLQRGMNEENTQHTIFDRRHRMCPEHISLLGNVSKTDDSMAGADTGKFASSTTDFIDSMLNNRQYGESQKKVLRTALQHDGKIPYAAYSTAWESYRQCLMERVHQAAAEPEQRSIFRTHLRFLRRPV